MKEFAAAACLIGFWSSNAIAGDMLEECREFGIKEFAATPGFRTLELKDNGLLFKDKFDGFAGNQYVSTVIHGEGRLVLASGASVVRFICLHAGQGKGPVFFYIIPEN